MPRLLSCHHITSHVISCSLHVSYFQFARMFGAVGARNCLHRARLPSPVDKAGITLFFTYEQYLKTSVITDFFVKHPRIMVPLLGKADDVGSCSYHVHALVM